MNLPVQLDVLLLVLAGFGIAIVMFVIVGLLLDLLPRAGGSREGASDSERGRTGPKRWLHMS